MYVLISWLGKARSMPETARTPSMRALGSGPALARHLGLQVWVDRPLGDAPASRVRGVQRVRALR